MKESAAFDRTHREPVNVMAAFQFAKGTKYEFTGKISGEHWESCPPLKRVKKDIPDLTRLTFGRFTVVGLHAHLNRRWVCRCSCGDYEVRSAKAVKNPENFGDRCTKCRRKAQERRDFEFHATGREIDPRKL